ncbi:hypothetical protein Aab01nite_62100 [Paractinoplanes abujensis]|nr:hypothetical protein Aab01nite_62100 [Actinoplanes abujensis]
MPRLWNALADALISMAVLPPEPGAPECADALRFRALRRWDRSAAAPDTPSPGARLRRPG